MPKKVPALSRTIPPEILEILGPPPLLSTEDKDLYYATLARFAKDLAPSDLVTWLLIKDLADYRVEIQRCRRGKLANARQGYSIHVESRLANTKLQLRGTLQNFARQPTSNSRRRPR
jgi:hypothetical protein